MFPSTGGDRPWCFNMFCDVTQSRCPGLLYQRFFFYRMRSQPFLHFYLDFLTYIHILLGIVSIVYVIGKGEVIYFRPRVRLRF